MDFKKLENLLRKEIVLLARLQHHKPYIHYESGPDTFDCAGLIWYLYYTICDIDLYQYGYGLSATTQFMTASIGETYRYEEDSLNKDLSIFQSGDILFFHTQSLREQEPRVNNRYPGHCGIVLSETSFMHASSSKKMIVISDFTKNPYWEQKLVGAKNILSDKQVLKRVKR